MFKDKPLPVSGYRRSSPNINVFFIGQIEYSQKIAYICKHLNYNHKLKWENL